MFERLTNTTDDFVVTHPSPGTWRFVFRSRRAEGAGLVWRLRPARHVGVLQPAVAHPWPLALLGIAAEFLGGIGLIIGFLGRVAALGIACNMGVAIALVHRHFGLFANWYGSQKGKGMEYDVLAIAIALAIMIRGSGALSIDRSLSTSL